MKNLNQHVKSDKVKWIITGIALVLILAVLGGVVAMLVMNRNSEESVPAYYTVTFDSNGGTSVDSQIIVPGGKVVKPENPVKSGVGFVEWQLDGEAYDFDTPVTSDITLVAYYL